MKKIKKQTKWTSFVARKEYASKTIVPKFLNSKDAEVRRIGSYMKDCGSTVRLAECGGCEKRYYAGHYRCKQKFCPECEHRKSMVWMARIMKELQDLSEKDVKFNIHHGVLTIRSHDELRDMIRVLEQGWRHISNGVKSSRKRFKDRFIGGVRSLEVKLGKHGWHAHYHLLMLSSTDYERDVDWLSEAWERGTKGHGKQVYIKTVSQNQVINAVLEVCKYIMKFDVEYDDEKLSEIVRALYRKRRVNTWGVLYGTRKKVEEDIKEMDKKEGNLEDFLCTVCGSEKARIIIARFEDIYLDYYDDVYRKERVDKGLN